MLPKPRHLSPEYAAAFTDPSVVAAYPNRPPYPPEAIEFLASLAVGTRASCWTRGAAPGTWRGRWLPWLTGWTPSTSPPG